MRPNTAALFLSTVLTVAPVCLTAQGYRFADIAWRSTGPTVKKLMVGPGPPRHRASPSRGRPRPVVRPVERPPERDQLLFGLCLACLFVGFCLASYGVHR